MADKKEINDKFAHGQEVKYKNQIVKILGKTDEGYVISVVENITVPEGELSAVE